MPPANHGDDTERAVKAQRYVMKGGVTARTAIKEFAITNREDICLIRFWAATRDIGANMAAPDAIRLNDVDDAKDDRKLRLAGAERAVRKGGTAPDAIRIHGVRHGNDIAKTYRQACSRSIEAGMSAVEAARQNHLTPQGYIFRQMALKGAKADLGRGRTAEKALDRNGVFCEADARDVFRSALRTRKQAYIKGWMKRVRADQEVAYAAEAANGRRHKPFEPVYYQPVAAFVDLVGIGAKRLIKAGRTGPEIIAELKINTPSHIAEIKLKCARRDFAGEDGTGALVGRPVSAMFALLRNKVEHKDDAERLLEEEVKRETEKQLDNWLGARDRSQRPASGQAPKATKRAADNGAEQRITKIRRLSATPSHHAPDQPPDPVREADRHARTSRSGRG